MRHKVTRQFRHLCATYRTAIPSGSIIVVRAQPSAAARSFGELTSDFRFALARLGHPTEVAVALGTEVDVLSNPRSSSQPTSGATCR